MRYLTYFAISDLFSDISGVHMRPLCPPIYAKSPTVTVTVAEYAKSPTVTVTVAEYTKSLRTGDSTVMLSSAVTWSLVEGVTKCRAVSSGPTSPGTGEGWALIIFECLTSADSNRWAMDIHWHSFSVSLFVSNLLWTCSKLHIIVE